MYDISIFEKLIRSNLSAQEIFDKIFEINPIYTKQKYSNDEEEPFAIYVGGLGEDDLVTVNAGLEPLTMKFDDKSIYVEFINLVRDKLNNKDESFEKIVLSAIKNLSRNWFYDTNDEKSKQNSLLANRYIEAYRNPANQRNCYASDPRVSQIDEKNYRIIYGISKFKGVGDLVKCVEVNSVACNLLAFSGLETVLIQGYFISPNGKRDAHTFPIYKNSDGNYNLLDCMLKMKKDNILPENVDFEQGFEFSIPVYIQHKDGSKEPSSVLYRSLAQKKIDKSSHPKK